MIFNYNNTVVQSDLKRMAEMPMLKDSFQDKTILVTGGTGMLATYIIYILCFLCKECSVNLKILALCRSKDKADALFGDFYKYEWFTLLLQDVCTPIDYSESVDYIFHLAGNASPYFIKNDPVGILKSNLLGTMNLLEFAKRKQSLKILFASTREVYGKNEDVKFLKESDFGAFDCLDDRSCYPESKRAAESLCRSYFLQYGINYNVVRIAHSYGPGMNLKNDGRVMADLMANSVNHEDIVLKSNGTAERAFCYITDAVSAIFFVLLRGESGRAYNIANESEPISIKNLAHMLATLGGVNVVYNIAEHQSNVYCNYKRSGLDCTELKKLGWVAAVDLKEGCLKTFNSFKLCQ